MKKNKTKSCTASIYIRDAKVWKAFKKFCKDENMSASLFIEATIRNILVKPKEQSA